MEVRFETKIFLPCKQLARYINCFYVFKEDGLFKDCKAQILNNGFTEMLIQLGDMTEFYNCDKDIRNRCKISLSGQYLDKILTIPKGKTHIISVNFRLGGMYGIFGIPQHFFTSSNIDLSDIDATGSALLWEKLAEQKDTQKQIHTIEDYLIKQIDKKKHPVLEMQHAVSVIAQQKGNTSIQSVADILKISVRTFNRRFYNQVGITPKQLSEIYRVNNVCNYMLKNKKTDLLDIALKFGYYDASHLIKTFQNYLYITPVDLYNKVLLNGGYCDKITIVT